MVKVGFVRVGFVSVFSSILRPGDVVGWNEDSASLRQGAPVGTRHTERRFTGWTGVRDKIGFDARCGCIRGDRELPG